MFAPLETNFQLHNYLLQSVLRTGYRDGYDDKQIYV